jgi:hypothetical protein
MKKKPDYIDALKLNSIVTFAAIGVVAFVVAVVALPIIAILYAVKGLFF